MRDERNPDQGGGLKPVPRGFDHVRDWVFDLDNTLYPHEAGIWPQVDDRITLFVSDYFGADGLSARALQKYYYFRYGTTLKGLMIEQGVAADEFLDFVHHIDLSALEADTRLAAAMAALPGRRFIMTNGSRRHAENVAGKLGLLPLVEDIFDIAAAGLVPKPEPEAYARFVEVTGLETRRAAMFEDIERNLAVPDSLGMTTTLVLPKTRDPFREAHEQMAVDVPYVHHVTDDLAGFLESLTVLPRAAE